MRRLRLVLEYDGTAYCGFQRQPHGESVQAVLEEGLTAICGHPTAAVGAGRTDAGVHALGQVVHFETTGRIPANRVAWALNALLPPALAVRDVEETPAEFHARFSAVRRSYSYFVQQGQPAPFGGRYVLRESGLRPEAPERLRTAVAMLVGRHDFSPFSAGETANRRPERTLIAAGVAERGALLRIDLTADAFLRSMVRSIVGLLLDIGRGRREPEAVHGVLKGAERLRATVAPPQGLFLVRVDYPDGYPPPRPEWWPDGSGWQD